MNNVMNEAIKTVSFIRKRAFNHRQFKSYLDKCVAPFRDVIYFSDFRWLSKRLTLKAFFNLRKQFSEFLIETSIY